MKKTTTQCDRVLQYLRDFGSISQKEAIEDLGVMRLASRISDLRKTAIITSKWESAKNRYGETVTYKRYFLGGSENE